MIPPLTETIELHSRLGRVGSIRAYDPWESRKSVAAAKEWVSTIARLSHGLGPAEDFEAHFDRVVNRLHHESVLEFVPVLQEWEGVRLYSSLPAQSLRARLERMDDPEYWGSGQELARELDDLPELTATAFLVECPMIVARQWFRHRSEAYLEMSRRYVKGAKVPFTFYGVGFDPLLDALLDQALLVYDHLIDIGWAPELARIAIPQGAMTKFWVAGFDRDWEAFLKLRDDAHAQPEIRVFAQEIRKILEAKRSR